MNRFSKAIKSISLVLVLTLLLTGVMPVTAQAAVREDPDAAQQEQAEQKGTAAASQSAGAQQDEQAAQTAGKAAQTKAGTSKGEPGPAQPSAGAKQEQQAARQTPETPKGAAISTQPQTGTQPSATTQQPEQPAADPSTFTGVKDGKYYENGKVKTSDRQYFGTFEGILYIVTKSGIAKPFTGVYGKKYYNAGKLLVTKNGTYRVYNHYVYKVWPGGSAAVYKKNTKKKGTYVSRVNNVYYRIAYKTGRAAGFTGVVGNYFYRYGKVLKSKKITYRAYDHRIYKVGKSGRAVKYTGIYKTKRGSYYYKYGKVLKAKRDYFRKYNNYLYKMNRNGKAARYTGVCAGKYYKAGKLSRTRSAYYRIYKGRLYRITRSGKASPYIKNKRKYGTYPVRIEGKVYSISYRNAKAARYTGFYKGRFYSKAKASSKTGWFNYKGKRYYLKKGVRAVGRCRVGKRYYYFGSTGVLSVDQAMCRKAQKYTSKTKMLILVNKARRKVAVFTGSRGKWAMKRYITCTIGKPATPTPSGTYSVSGKGKFFNTTLNNIKATCWYFTRIRGPYLFHSVPYNSGSMRSVQDGRLGIAASHGCVRMAISNAKWIYNNVPMKTKIIIY